MKVMYDISTCSLLGDIIGVLSIYTRYHLQGAHRDYILFGSQQQAGISGDYLISTNHHNPHYLLLVYNPLINE